MQIRSSCPGRKVNIFLECGWNNLCRVLWPGPAGCTEGSEWSLRKQTEAGSAPRVGGRQSLIWGRGNSVERMGLRGIKEEESTGFRDWMWNGAGLCLDNWDGCIALPRGKLTGWEAGRERCRVHFGLCCILGVCGVVSFFSPSQFWPPYSWWIFFFTWTH